MIRMKFLVFSLFFMLLLGIPAWALFQDSAADLPEGEGKQLVGSLCAQCHNLGTVTSRRKSKQEWAETVEDMLARGAGFSPEEAEKMVDYLAQHFSPQPSTPPATAAPASPAAANAFMLPDAPGKEVLENKCFQCHSENMWRDLRLSKRDWEAVVYRMVGRGAVWSEEEIEAMSRYLSTAFPPAIAR
ncbi:MAG: hypothetical protein HY645_11540 [Acidobacteria bacterium]|nr:hypothetical protein [Acidobacteriota bacterium]